MTENNNSISGSTAHYHLCNTNMSHTHTYLAVMDVVSSGPTMFAGLFTMLPLEEIVYHGIILGTSSTRHTLETHTQTCVLSWNY